ncbi:1,4-beta-xylanase [Sphingomonas deserti]|uniref:1,4-beta-xylanase n=1 Tax=Allosphingosinicella deserti TaxID=2116704 RepID=A0A2P7QSW2_9SPHN|nr:1,4-beta-xylanase [Sphingomonas deserti]
MSAADAVRGNPARWSQDEARRWYADQPWITGANYTNASSINQLDMWQAATWNPAEIDKELGWARQFGMNSMRVYLHDLAYEQDPEGLKRRIGEFLTIADRHGIRPIFVLFDSCWDPDPVIGPQHKPIPGVHNSGWVQSPGRRDLIDPTQDAGFRRYVEDIVGTFARDKRVLAWDVWNEPDNPGGGMYNDDQLAQENARIEQLLPQVFAWARAQKPVQPLTSGVWIGPDWSPGAPQLTAIQRIQLAESDVVTFHNYEWPESFEARIAQLRPYGRPLICTEWMARSAGSTVDTILPIARRENVGMINWGFVQGESQTHLPWDSWERPYTLQQPVAWFHDLLKPDGTPYRPREAEIFREQRKSRARAR